MMVWIKNNLLITLSLLAAIFLATSVYLYTIEEQGKWVTEVARSLMNLSFTVIFGGIVKLIFDKYQDDKRANEKIKDFKSSMINQLRNVFDQVDGGRLLIEAHKSAKTYSERIQQDIIPSIVTLFDMKRSLFDSDYSLEKYHDELRLSLHYMIAYLKALANEYRDKYPAISNKQYQFEKLKEKASNNFVAVLTERYPDNFYSDEVLLSHEIHEMIPANPLWVWNEIKSLPHMGAFIRDDSTGPYHKMFVDFYEHSKKILKGIKPKADSYPLWYEENDMQRMKKITWNIRHGIRGDSLVNEMVNTIPERIKKHKADVPSTPVSITVADF
jgi:hypothetical protein